MYLKTYAKFTFCIKSQGHVSDENFRITVCIQLAKFFPRCFRYIRQKDSLILIVKVFIFLDMYLKTYMDIFSDIFKMVTPRALRQLLLFIALICLTSATFVANLCSHLISSTLQN